MSGEGFSSRFTSCFSLRWAGLGVTGLGQVNCFFFFYDDTLKNAQTFCCLTKTLSLFFFRCFVSIRLCILHLYSRLQSFISSSLSLPFVFSSLCVLFYQVKRRERERERGNKKKFLDDYYVIKCSQNESKRQIIAIVAININVVV